MTSSGNNQNLSNAVTQALALPLPHAPGQRLTWKRLPGSATSLALLHAAHRHNGPLLVVCPDASTATQLELELDFYQDSAKPLPVLPFPDRETLPYDHFSPHQDIVSQRLSTLYRLTDLARGIVIAPAATIMHRLPPRRFLDSHMLLLHPGQRFDIDSFRRRLESAGYSGVPQVMEHGEFAVRGSIIDLFPMGAHTPYRIDLLDDELESIRMFDPETQRSQNKIDRIELLPAKEFPVTEEGIKQFRQNFREAFAGDPQRCSLYRDISNGVLSAGIEYYLPLFFAETHTLFDYLPASTLVCVEDETDAAAETFWREAVERYEQRRYDNQRPILPPAQLFLQRPELFARINTFARVDLRSAKAQGGETSGVEVQGGQTAWFEILDGETADVDASSGVTAEVAVVPPMLPIATVTPNAAASATSEPLAAFLSFMNGFTAGRILIAAESAGRRETLLDLLAQTHARPAPVDTWSQFLRSDSPFAITVAPLERGLLLTQPKLAVISETQLFGDHVVQRRRRQRRGRDADAIIRDLAELHPDTPVVHEEHGIGRYRGLQTLDVGGTQTEFLLIEYAGNDKLYVPVASLHLISRYSGVSPEQAPLHKLGTDTWQKAKERAARKALDVAAELLDLYAQRAARQGHKVAPPDAQYAAFAATFPFEETPDQATAIQAVVEDMTSGRPMDRLICGDVGFGKTEVAMRAAFLAAVDGQQVAVLVPTTLLAQQHYQNFRDRFADWPIRIESLSRFRSTSDQQRIIADLAAGTVDIVIGTHKLLQPEIKFKQLGLVIIDEEHRFGVRQKEKFKALRANVDVLTLSATPIPRSMNMALSALRDLSIIATPPSKRLAIKTFIQEWSDATIHEACLREIRRGGQVYFVHNDIDTIERIADQLTALVPESTVRVGHGQMSERDLERVMRDFYHQRFNILVCTTIIETGIDVPTANTMVINRADRFGLAQLYQLRGRIGRSHHRAYAYLVIPPRAALSKDAEKRLDALASMEELGTGFTLAMHDLEIRGAGEILGDEQSGQIQEIGFDLYSELLERAVRAIQRGEKFDVHQPVNHGAEVELNVPALIPNTYLPDVHARLRLYKRISNAQTDDELRELQVEMIDRFGLLPQETKNLFEIMRLRQRATELGIRKLEAHAKGGRIVFMPTPKVRPEKIIRLIQTKTKEFKLDGDNKLRFIMEVPQAPERIKAVNQVLDAIA